MPNLWSVSSFSNSFSRMWTEVKFEYDQQVIVTPLSNFKDHLDVAEELKIVQTRPFYDVFWSPDPDDTPEKIMKRESRILHQDKLRTQVLTGKRSKSATFKPDAGWYRASIRQWDGKNQFSTIYCLMLQRVVLQCYFYFLESLEKLEKLLDDPSGRKRKLSAEIVPAEEKVRRRICIPTTF